MVSAEVPLLRRGGSSMQSIDTNTSGASEALCTSFLRLIVVFFLSAVCGGILPGQAVYSSILAEAGLFSGLCEDATNVCDGQYLVITNTLQTLMAFTLITMMPSGMLFDAIGGQKTGAAGAVLVGLGFALIEITLRFHVDGLFIPAVLIADLGAGMENMAFLAFLWHLPGWQALVLALSNCCLQVSAGTPVFMRMAMERFGLSVLQVFDLYVLAVLLSAWGLYKMTPSQEEYYSQAAQVLNMPVPRASVKWIKLKKSVRDAWRVLRHDLGQHTLVTLSTMAGFTSTCLYTAYAAPFGTALFGAEADGTRLSNMINTITAIVGLCAGPLAGAFVDKMGLRAIRLLLLASLVVVYWECGKADWFAQTVACICVAIWQNFVMLFMIRYVFFFPPAHLLGTTQGLFLVFFAFLAMFAMGGLSGAMATYEPGPERFLAPCLVLMFVAFAGGVVVEILVKDQQTRVMLKDTEVEVAQRFLVGSMDDAAEILDMSRLKVVQMAASDNVLHQQKLMHVLQDPATQVRILVLAEKKKPSPTPLPVREVKLDDGYYITDRREPGESALQVLLSAFNGDTSVQAMAESPCRTKKEGCERVEPSKGEPFTEWLLGKEFPDPANPSRQYFLKFFMGTGFYPGQAWGHILELRHESMPEEVLGMCICYPPGCLDNGQACEIGSERWFYALANMNMNVPYFDVEQFGMSVLQRFVNMGSSSMVEQHKKLAPHWYVATLGVSPKWRGLGAGKKLLSVVADWATKDNVDVFLECAKRNVPIYSKCGFRPNYVDSVAGGSEPGAEPCEIYGMVRKPGKA